jgi:hypothetical protein
MLFITPANAAAIEFSVDSLISGDAVFAIPAARLTFTDIAVDTVQLEIDSMFTDPACPAGQTCFGGLETIFFNVNSGFVPQSVTVGSLMQTGSFFVQEIRQIGQDQVFATGWTSGAGWDFGVYLDQFETGDTFTFTLSAPGLTANDFAVAQADGLSAMAFPTWCISQLPAPGFGCLNANYADVDGPSSPTPVPESASALLIASGLGLFFARRWLQCRG